MRVRLGKQDGGENGGSRIAIAGESGEEIGFVDCSVSDGWLEVRWIELAVEHRRRGLGAEAVRLLEAEAEERWGVRGMRAHVPRDVGLALYFWLRLGYRPEVAVAGEGDTMAVVRELEPRS
jgi:ribosomal protein S18 acetylase RimI-like enzyme